MIIAQKVLRIQNNYCTEEVNDVKLNIYKLGSF